MQKQKITKSYRYIRDDHISAAIFPIGILCQLSFVVHRECLQHWPMKRPMFPALLHSSVWSPTDDVKWPTFFRSHCLVVIPNSIGYVSLDFGNAIQFVDSSTALPCLFSLFLVLLRYLLCEMLEEFCRQTNNIDNGFFKLNKKFCVFIHLDSCSRCNSTSFVIFGSPSSLAQLSNCAMYFRSADNFARPASFKFSNSLKLPRNPMISWNRIENKVKKKKFAPTYLNVWIIFTTICCWCGKTNHFFLFRYFRKVKLLNIEI